MAARKSCTHLSWSDAKSASGEGGAKSVKKNAPKKLTHQQILAQRIRQGGKFVEGNKPWTRQQIDRHMSAKEREKREEEIAAELEQKEAERLEQERISRIVKPSEQARAQMTHFANRLQREDPETWEALDTGEEEEEDFEKLQQIFECRRMQVDEIDALEAIFTDTDEFLVSDASQLDELRALLEQVEEDETNQANLKALARHPLLACSLQLSITDPRVASGSSNDGMELVASILLHVRLPLLYPANHDASPSFDFKYVMVTDVNEQCGIDKALVSLSYLDEIGLREQLLVQSKEVMPDPCIYEVANTFMTENVFNFMQMETHALLTRK